jgi:hypothetical protein
MLGYASERMNKRIEVSSIGGTALVTSWRPTLPLRQIELERNINVRDISALCNAIFMSTINRIHTCYLPRHALVGSTCRVYRDPAAGQIPALSTLYTFPSLLCILLCL